MRTVRGTTVPTLNEKLMLVTRGALAVSTVERIWLFCSVVRFTPPLAGAAPVVCCCVPVCCCVVPDCCVPDFCWVVPDCCWVGVPDFCVWLDDGSLDFCCA